MRGDPWTETQTEGWPSLSFWSFLSLVLHFRPAYQMCRDRSWCSEPCCLYPLQCSQPNCCPNAGCLLFKKLSNFYKRTHLYIGLAEIGCFQLCHFCHAALHCSNHQQSLTAPVWLLVWPANKTKKTNSGNVKCLPKNQRSMDPFSGIKSGSLRKQKIFSWSILLHAWFWRIRLPHTSPWP